VFWALRSVIKPEHGIWRQPSWGVVKNDALATKILSLSTLLQLRRLCSVNWHVTCWWMLGWDDKRNGRGRFEVAVAVLSSRNLSRYVWTDIPREPAYRHSRWALILSITAGIATSTRLSQLHSLPLGWVVNYDRRAGWEVEVRGVTQWWRQEFLFHGLIVMHSATLDENVTKKRTQHLGAQIELLPYVHSLTFLTHCGLIIMHTGLWPASWNKINLRVWHNIIEEISSYKSSYLTYSHWESSEFCNSVLRINKGNLVNAVKVLTQ